LLDRIDLHVDVPALPAEDLQSPASGMSSADAAARVAAAREIQTQRQGKPNSHLTNAEIDRFCRCGSEGEQLLKQAIDRLHLSARAYHRILKVARTLADLAGREAIGREDIAEAVQYRRQLAQWSA
jgi:magnesium chelatase family protein